jgi:hypothetical protein
MPLRVDGSKAPKIPWSCWQAELLPPELLRRHFSDERVPSAIGVICGVTSGNLELLDFDDPGAYKPWIRAVAKKMSGVLGYAPLVATPSDGRHIYIRCPEIAGNQKLAYDEKGQIAIETRGQGGQAVLPGEPLGTHHSREPYKLIGGSFERIPTISPAQRQILLEISRSFDKSPAKPDRSLIKPERIDVRSTYGIDLHAGGAALVGDRPGDDFNERTDWPQLLAKAGWTWLRYAGGIDYWRRPGKSDGGASATTGFCGDKLHVFSSNCHPLVAGSTYTKFSFYALLWHEGDFAAAASVLAKNGYGKDTVHEQEEKLNLIIKGGLA